MSDESKNNWRKTPKFFGGDVAEPFDDMCWGSGDLWEFFLPLFPVPAGRFVLLGRLFSQSRNAAPSLHVSVEWFNFLACAKAVGFSSFHFLTRRLNNYSSLNFWVTRKTPVKEITTSVYWFIMWKKRKQIISHVVLFEVGVPADLPHFLSHSSKYQQSVLSTVTFGFYSEFSLSISTKPILHHPA